MDVKPLYNQLFVKLDPQEEPPTNGIIELDAITEKSRVITGTVTAIGEYVQRLKVGDSIRLSCFVGETDTIDGEKYQIVQEEDVYAYQSA